MAEAHAAPAEAKRAKTWKRPITRLAYRPDEAAAALGLSDTQFARWKARGWLPEPFQIGDVVLYDAAQLSEAWDTIKGRYGQGRLT